LGDSLHLDQPADHRAGRGGIANAINIIDGFNGLASVVSICMLLSLAYVALQVNDAFVLVATLLVAGAITGFLIWNYPVGLIFSATAAPILSASCWANWPCCW
jgi:hypothetical protein